MDVVIFKRHFLYQWYFSDITSNRTDTSANWKTEEKWKWLSDNNGPAKGGVICVN